MLFSTIQTLPFEGHTMGYQCKGLNQSNIVCEYEVNLSTNEKVINENFYTNCSSNNLANKCFLWSKICIEFEGKKTQHWFSNIEIAHKY